VVNQTGGTNIYELPSDAVCYALYLPIVFLAVITKPLLAYDLNESRNNCSYVQVGTLLPIMVISMQVPRVSNKHM